MPYFTNCRYYVFFFIRPNKVTSQMNNFEKDSSYQKREKWTLSTSMVVSPGARVVLPIRFKIFSSLFSGQTAIPDSLMFFWPFVRVSFTIISPWDDWPPSTACSEPSPEVTVVRLPPKFTKISFWQVVSRRSWWNEEIHFSRRKMLLLSPPNLSL